MKLRSKKRYQIKRILKKWDGDINMSELARLSNTTKQELAWWRTSDNTTICNPIIGINKMRTLFEEIKNSDEITDKQFKRFKKCVNMAAICTKYFGGSSATVSVTISRHDPNVYRREIKRACHHLLKKSTTKKVEFKVKLK